MILLEFFLYRYQYVNSSVKFQGTFNTRRILNIVLFNMTVAIYLIVTRYIKETYRTFYERKHDLFIVCLKMQHPENTTASIFESSENIEWLITLNTENMVLFLVKRDYMRFSFAQQNWAFTIFISTFHRGWRISKLPYHLILQSPSTETRRIYLLVVLVGRVFLPFPLGQAALVAR